MLALLGVGEEDDVRGVVAVGVGGLFAVRRPGESPDLADIGDVLGEEFECDAAVKARLVGFVDHTHPAAAKPLDDMVVRYG